MAREHVRVWRMWALAAVGAVSVLVAAVLALSEPRAGPIPLRPGLPVFGIPVSLFVIGAAVWWHAPGHPLARRLLAATTVVAMNSALITLEVRTFPAEWWVAREPWLWPWWAQASGQIAGVLMGVWVLPPLSLLSCFIHGQPPLTSFVLGLWLLFVLAVVLQAIRYARLPVVQQRQWRSPLRLGVLIAEVSAVPLRPWDPLGGNPCFRDYAVGLRGDHIGGGRRPIPAAGSSRGCGGRPGTDALAGSRALGPRSRKPHRYGTGDRAAVALILVALLAAYVVRVSAELAARVPQIQQQTAELAASRTRIVRTPDVERRHIERDLHDGIQHDLVALLTKLHLAHNKLPPGTDRPGAILTEVQVEVPAFFLVSEALTNVLKHAYAARATVRFSTAGRALLVEVAANPDGGTTVRASLPDREATDD